jgi:hypothetical protein
MKPKVIFSVLFFLFSCVASYSQDYFIVKTLAGDDSNSFVTLRYGRKDYGFGVINSKGTMNWQTTVPGFPVGMGRFKNNVVFFYTLDNPEKLGSINEVHAAMIGIKEKKILADKVVYTNPNKNVIEPVVLNDPAGDFNYLLIRISGQRGGLASLAIKAENKTHEFTQLSIISLESNLETHIKDLKDIALETFFAGACAGNNNEVYVSSFSKDQLITERFDDDGNLKGKLAVDASIRRKSAMDPIIEIFPVIKYDSLQGNCDLAVRYRNDHKDEVMRLFRFNFNDQKAYSTEETPLDKDYVKQLEKVQGKKNKLSNFKSIDELYPVQILETNNKVIVLKEIQYETGIGSSNDPEKFYREGNIISIYTKDLQQVSDVIIDKFMETYIMGGTSICSQVKNGKLYVITCELGRRADNYKAVLSIINMDDGAIETSTLDKEDAGKGWITDPTTILWFNNNFIIPFTEGKAFLRLKFKTDLQSENY